ncbi:FAD dependent oxidoreductase [Phellopilus nigrolimitatus]|nr:FAD dependent oxidoreductase [Phellopilus nigrolimitatus]
MADVSTSNQPEARKTQIVIIGAGIIGCSSAYYITHHPSYSPDTTSVTILEASSVAGGASGKAGGLIAKWAYPRELVDVTFQEHERLAREHDGANRWGWRFTNVGQWEGEGEDEGGEEGSEEEGAALSLHKKDGIRVAEAVSGPGAKSARKQRILPDDLDWVKESLTRSYEPMAKEGETAQVHPYLFTTSMCALAQEKGAQLVLGKATSIAYAARADGGKQAREVAGVSYTDASTGAARTLPASHVLVAAGPWTPALLPQVPISGMRAHSITIRPTRPLSAYALFTEIALPGAARRARGARDLRAPERRGVRVRAGRRAAAAGSRRRPCRSTRAFDSGPRGCPIVGEDESVKGLVIAAGHTCWGICNAPGTAKAVSELVMDGKITCGDFRRMSPRMFT